MSDSDESNSSDADNKMKKLLDDWDSDEDDNGSKYVDSDSDSDDGKSNTKDSNVVRKKATAPTKQPKKIAQAISDSDSDDASSGPNDSSSSNSSEDNDDDNDNSESSSKSDDDDDDDDDEDGSSSSNSSSADDVSEDDAKTMEGDDDDDDDEEDEVEETVAKVEEKKNSKSATKSRDVAPVAPSKGQDSDNSDDDAEEDDVDDDDDDDDCGADTVVDKFKKKPKVKKEKIKVQKVTEVTDDDDPEAAEMKKLLAGWGDDANDDDDDNSSLNSDEDDDSEDPSEREIELDDHVLDHIVLAAHDLDEAMSTFETMSGVRPIVAGTIKGLGIKCARVSFSDATYLEIIAPDPESPGPIGQLLLRQNKNMSNNELIPFHYAIRSTRADKLKDEVKKFGYVPDHISMFGTKKDGTPRKWELLFLYKHTMGGLCPFVINWANSEHPCTTLPIVGKLKKFTVRFPENDPAHELLKHINISSSIINVEIGKPKLSFQFSSPEGTVKFAATKATGFKFPGFDDDENDIIDNDDISFEAPKTPELLDVADDSY